MSNVFCLTQGSGDIVDDWLQSKLQSGKTWEGPINCARKTGDFVPLEEITHESCFPSAYAPPIRQFPESIESGFHNL